MRRGGLTGRPSEDGGLALVLGHCQIDSFIGREEWAERGLQSIDLIEMPAKEASLEGKIREKARAEGHP